MRALISIEHPAWSWQFKKIIQQMSAEDDILVLAVEKDGDTRLLKNFGIDYKLMAGSTGRNVIEKAYLFLKLCMTYTIEALRYKPDILIGRASPMMAVAAFVCRKPHLIFEDTEVSKFSLRICKALSSKILTPENFLSNLGSKQVRIPMYKELFYLHEKEFSPDVGILREHGLKPDEPYVVVRFVSWNASHDVGLKGLSREEKIHFIQELAAQVKVYITSEGELPGELEQYRLKTPFDVIHHVLYYATLVISEGGTTASEAAVLGTHALYLNEIESGTTIEQEKKYKLLRVLHDPSTRYDIALREVALMLQNPNYWNEGKEKRARIMADMADPNETYMDYMKLLVDAKEDNV